MAFKQFLEVDIHYAEEDLEQNKRLFQSMGPGGLQVMNMAA